jgi:regulator of replication initiation timing
MQQTDKYMVKIYELQQHVDMLTLIGKDLVEENNQLKDDVQKLWKKLKDCNDDVPFKELYPDLPRYKKRTWAGYFKSFVVKGAK